jgi:hypothetical protein
MLVAANKEKPREMRGFLLSPPGDRATMLDLMQHYFNFDSDGLLQALTHLRADRVQAACTTPRR